MGWLVFGFKTKIISEPMIPQTLQQTLLFGVHFFSHNALNNGYGRQGVKTNLAQAKTEDHLAG